ncbi:MAG: hypothetical protein J0M18_07005 [Ignavibacteria bacterium]|nr:hypothetical protein [Ignavibacteria bacterium]
MFEQLIETFGINNRINIYLLTSLNEEYLKDRAGSKGRSVGEQFAHIHNVRLMWLKASAPELMQGLNKIEKENPVTRELLEKELKASGEAIKKLIEQSYKERDGKVKGFKPHCAAFVGYLISHDSHHRGQIMLALKQSGHPVDKKIQFGLWEWGVR